jgi:hypothetical protein
MPPVKGKVTKASKWICVYKDDVLVGTYPSMTKAAEAFDVRVQNVWRAINVYQTSLKGYVFKLMNEKDSIDYDTLYERRMEWNKYQAERSRVGYWRDNPRVPRLKNDGTPDLRFKANR